MRVVLVIAVYPPDRAGGATIYAVSLAECLVRMGIQVDVFCAGSWSEGPSHFNGMTEDSRNGVRVHRIHLNWRRAPAPFDYLYDNATLAPVFRQLFRQCQPDVVHVISVRMLSARVVEEAKRMGLPVVLHLHEFRFLCPLLNLVRKDGSICDGPKSAWGCQSCILAGSKAFRWTACLLPSAVQQCLYSVAGRIPWLTRQPGLIGMLGNMARHQAYMRNVLDSVDLVMTPARFSIEMFARDGFATDHFMYSPLGLDLEWVRHVRRTASDHVRFGFTGHLQRIKGVHTLVDAFNALPVGLPARLCIYGDPGQETDYVASLRSRANPNILWKGSFSRDHLAEVLSDLDVVIVPSICHELNPNVIREAFAAGVPVIVSDRRGPREAVQGEVNGLYFRAADSQDLKRQLLRIVTEEGLLDRLRGSIPAVRTIEEDAQEMLDLYVGLASEQKERGCRQQEANR